jgi:hypothetical protein
MSNKFKICYCAFYDQYFLDLMAYLVPYVLKISTWSLKFLKFKLVSHMKMIKFVLTNSNFRNLSNQLEMFKT